LAYWEVGASDCKIARPFDRCIRGNGFQSFQDPAKNVLIRGSNLIESRSAVVCENQAETEAAGAEQHRAAATGSPQYRYAVSLACRDIHIDDYRTTCTDDNRLG
jgi:hypothetical protein